MGCCYSAQNHGRPSIELDYEESLLSLAESAHPLAAVPAEALLAEFWTQQPVIELARVLQGCATLQLGDWLTLSSYEYLEALKTGTQQLSTRKFLSSCLLLGRGSAEQKRDLWLQFLNEVLTMEELRTCIGCLVDTSVELLPLLAVAKFSPGKLTEYVAGLRSSRNAFVNKATIDLIGDQPCTSKTELQKQFDQHPKYLQLFTPSLTRLLLLRGVATVQHTRDSSSFVQPPPRDSIDSMWRESVEPVLVQVQLAGRTEDLIVYLDEDPEEVATAFADKLGLTAKEQTQVLESILYIRQHLADSDLNE